MAAPTLSARLTPLGIDLHDGYNAEISFLSDPDVSFWEKSVQPPGLDGGDAIDTTTMHNTLWRTLYPRSLITMTEANVVASYDPNVYNQIILLINRIDSITVHFSDLSTLVFWGFLRVFTPQPLVEGTHPEANIVIQPTNYDVANNAEEAPVLTETAGT